MNHISRAAFTTLATLCLGASAQTADPCKTQSNTVEMDACAKQTLTRQDKALNEAYQKLMKSLVPDDKDDRTDYTDVRKKLVDAQRAWITYRDNDCKAKLRLNENGTMRGVIYLGCLSDRTEQRTKELLQWVSQ
jgi:uncharacterized protein YecT (DUF1311 family)